VNRGAAFAGRLGGRACRALAWPFRTVWRVLALGWLVGFAIVGAAGSAAADTGLIGGPDLSGGAAQTVFEQAPWAGYGMPVFVPPTYAWPEQALWGAVNFLCLLLQTISAMVVRGALAAMQWMLNLTLYRDNAAEIDTATNGVASEVFWPLIGCTVAGAGFTMYARARRDGGGSILGEAVKVTVLSVLAIAFVAHPSNILGPLDDARTAGANAIMTGYSSGHLADGGAVAGFPPVTIPAGPNSASRTLADSMWSTFVLTPWCYATFGGEDLCRQWGQDYITKSPKWVAFAQVTMAADLKNGLSAGSEPDNCVQTFADACDTVRGVTMNRLAASLVGALVAIPLALMLLLLTVFGLLAALGVLFLALMVPLFAVGWMIPGIPRTIGLKWFQALIGCMIQSALIAALLGVVMVLGAIFQAMIPTYGFWAVGLLNLVVMIMALKVRGMFENLTGLSHPAASGLMSSYVAMKTLGAVGRMGKRVGHAGASAIGATSKGIAAGAAHGSAGYMNDGARKLQQTTAAPRGGRLRQHFAPAQFMPVSARTGPVADAARQTAGPRAITTGVRATPWAPRPAGFPHSEPKVDQGARNWGGTGKPGDIPSAARTRVDPSDQPFRPTPRGHTVTGAPPMRQTVNVPPRRDPLAITRRPKPVTPRAQLPGPRPVRPPQTSAPRPVRELLPVPVKGGQS